MSDPNQAPSRVATPARLAALASLLGLVVAFALLSSLGAQQAQQTTRVLGVLDPLVDWLRSTGRGWMFDAAARNGMLLPLVSLALGVVLVVAIATRRQHAWPLGFMVLAFGLAGWGQLALVNKDLSTGSYLYAAAVLCAVTLGFCCPAPHLDPRQALPRFTRRDAAWMFGLTLLALLLRLYALTELPRMFNGEAIISMLASRTLDGLRWYVPVGITSNSTGQMHLMPQWLFYHLFGTSVYALRLAGVAFGMLAIPLFYWLALRLGGRLGAVLATLLMISAPEQLYWSRIESTNFAPVPVLSLIAAHLGLSMAERFAFFPVLLSALWIPFGRYFYTAGAAMVFLPWLQTLHGIVFVPRAWRRMWYVLPLLALGTALWTISLSFLSWLLSGGSPFTGSNPATHGELILRGVAEYTGLPMSRLIVLQIQSAWNNLWTIIGSLAYHGGFSEWFERGLAVPGVTLMVPAVVALVAVSLAYLSSQPQRPRAFLILAWLVVGLLPAVLSMQATDRRFLLIFPVLYLAVGTSAQAFVDLGRERGGRLAGWLVGILLTVSVVAASLANLTSHFLLPTSRTGVEDLITYSKAWFDESDTIFFDTDESWALVLAFGNADHFLEAPPCYRNVRVGEWLQVVLQPSCAYDHQAYAALLPRSQVDALRDRFDPQHITLLVDLYTPSHAMLDTLRGLFPEALQREHRVQATPSYVALSIDRATLQRLRTPELRLRDNAAAVAELEKNLLYGTLLQRSEAEPPSGGMASVHGGFYVEKSGWYDVALAPACPAASLSIDGKPTDGEARPMLNGIHRFELQLAAIDACRLPLELRMRSAPRPDGAPSNPTLPPLVAPYAVEVEGAAAKPLQTFVGYGPSRVLPTIPGSVIVDFDTDASGDLVLLTQEPAGKLKGRRLSPEGVERLSWAIDLPSYLPVWGINVAPNGTSYIVAGGPVFIYDRSGKQISHWPTPAILTAEITPLDDGRVLSAVVNENAIYVLDANGNLLQDWREYEGGSGKFQYPVSIDMDANGTIVVLHDTNEVLLFKTPLDRFEPRFEGSFHVDYLEPPNPRRFAFDGSDRLLFLDPSAETTLTYRYDGMRLLAKDTTTDLTTRGFHAPFRIRSTAESIYVLDQNRQLWSLPRH